MAEIIRLGTKNSRAIIYSGKLVSFEYKGIEYIHGGGKPEELKRKEDFKGWQDSEIIMFPVIGAVVDYKIQVGDMCFNQDLHGIARSLEFIKEKSGDNYIELVQRYDGVTTIKNLETGVESPKYLEWPFKYEIKKSIELTEGSLEIGISLTNKSDKDMLYMLGFHPAFKVLGNPEEAVFTESGNKHSLKEIVKESVEGIGAFFLQGVKRISYKNTGTDRGFEFSSINFNDMMIWSPGEDSGMFCIEPLTNLPVRVPSERRYFIDKSQYQLIGMRETVDYRVIVKPI